jgi:hypothetical protein
MTPEEKTFMEELWMCDVSGGTIIPDIGIVEDVRTTAGIDLMVTVVGFDGTRKLFAGSQLFEMCPHLFDWLAERQDEIDIMRGFEHGHKLF